MEFTLSVELNFSWNNIKLNTTWIGKKKITIASGANAVSAVIFSHF